jgi:hypothetical protein
MALGQSDFKPRGDDHQYRETVKYSFDWRNLLTIKLSFR